MWIELNISKVFKKRNAHLEKILKLEIYKYIINTTDKLTKIKWNNYIQNILGIKLTFDELLLKLVNSLAFTISNNQYVIITDPNKQIKNYKADMLFRLINYGNLSIKGTHMFDKAFDFIKSNIGYILANNRG